MYWGILSICASVYLSVSCPSIENRFKQKAIQFNTLLETQKNFLCCLWGTLSQFTHTVNVPTWKVIHIKCFGFDGSIIYRIEDLDTCNTQTMPFLKGWSSSLLGWVMLRYMFMLNFMLHTCMRWAYTSCKWRPHTHARECDFHWIDVYHLWKSYLNVLFL